MINLLITSGANVWAIRRGSPLEFLMPRGKSQRLKSIIPEISLRSVYAAYFIHDGSVYPVAGSSSEIFTSAVHQLAGGMWDDVAEKLLQTDDVDITSRFYILNRLTEKGIPMKLYTSRLEAEKNVETAIHPSAF